MQPSVQPTTLSDHEPRWRLVEHVRVAIPGGLQLRAAGRAVVLRGGATPVIVDQLFRLLDGTRTEQQVIDELDGQLPEAAVRRVLRQLRSKRMLEVDRNQNDDDPSWRVLRRYLHAEWRDGADALERLRAARVALIGASPLADAVEAELGRVAVRDCRRREETKSDARPELADCTVTVQLLDRPAIFSPAALAVNDAALAAGIPWLPVATLEDEVIQLGPFVFPGMSACLRCFELGFSRATSFLPPRWIRRAAAPGRLPDAGYAAAVAALVAIEVTRAIVSGQPPVSTSGVVTFDLATLETRRQPVSRVPRCSACGATRQRPRLRAWS